MTTPNDQNFDSFPNDDPGYGVLGPRTLGSFVVEGHRTDPGGGGDLSTIVYDNSAVGVSIGSGRMLGFNYGSIYTADWWQFRSVSATDNFKLASLAIESSSYGWDDVITVSGYNDSGLAVSATVDLNASGSYGSITYVKLGGAVGGTLTFGAGWGNIDTVRFAGQAGDLYGTQLWIDNIDVSPAAAITSAAYNAASGVLTVTASGVSAGESIASSKLTLTGQGAASYALTSGAVIAGAGSFSITLNAADKLAVNGLLNKNLGAADDGTTFNLAGAAGWNSTSGAEIDGTSPISVSNVTTPTIGSATYNAATHVLSVSGANLVGTIGAANDVTVARLTLTGEGGAAYALTGANVDVASASGFSLTLAGADREQVELMFNRSGTAATGATAYNLSAADNWNTSFTGGNSAIPTVGVTVSNVATPSIASASYDAATGTLVVAGSALTHAAGAANDIVANKLTFTGQGGATYTLTDTANVDVASSTSFSLVLSAADRGAVNLLLNKSGTQSNGGTAYNLAMGEDWAAGAAAAVVVADASGNAITVSNAVTDTTPPTATVGIADTALRSGETALVTITFSEAVSGFTSADLTVANGTLGALASSDGGVTWTATFTPTAGITDATNVIVLDQTGVVDAAGNAGVGTASSANYAIDTAAPTAAIVLSDSALSVGESATVTITFSEAVTGFALSDLSAGSGALSALSSPDGGVTWSATLTPTAATTSAANVVTLAANSLTDAAGNANLAATSSANYAVDTARPTASVTLSDSALQAGETSTVTIAFSEAVTGFTRADMTASNGTLSAVASSDGGVTWTTTFTPTAGVTAGTNAITLNAAGLTDTAGNAGVGTVSSANYAIDTAPPTAAIVLSDSALSVGESATVTITFSEAVSGFALGDLSAGAGALSGLASADGGVTWTATFTPAAATTSAANVITLAANSLADLAGNANAGATSSANYTVDTVRPTASLTLSDSALKAGETSLVTIAFSEAVSGFSNADLTVAHGVLAPVSSADGGMTWTATFTPDAGVTAAANAITLDMTGVADGAGNAGAGAASSANYAIDTARPTASVAMSDTALSVGDTATVTITFSEAVSGFTNADLTVANGTLGALASGDGGVTWSAAFTPAAGITDATNLVTLDNTGVVDAAGNAGVATSVSPNYAIDTAAPTASITLSDSALTAGESATVTIAFSEAVTGLTLAGLSAGAGTLGGLASADGGVTWTATLTPSAATASAANVVTLAANSLADLAGNANAGAISSANYTVDTRFAASTVTLSDSALQAGETSVVTIAFSQAVSGFSNADLTVANGALSPVSSADGGITWTATFTPNAGITDATNTITLDNTGVTTAAGNAGVGVTTSANYAIDTLRPTASVAIDDSALKIGDAATVTITFSEAVTGFTSADLTVANGTLGALTSADGGVTWSAAFTPAAGVTAATNLVTLNAAGVSDAAGNAGVGTVSSANYAIDTAAPSAAIVLSDSALSAGESATVTITFSEAVTGLTLADLSAGAGALSGLSSADGGVTWSATFTPSAASASATNAITLAASSIADLAGNANAGATSSANYVVDTMRPTASVTLSDSALKAGETSVVTIAFSQAVTGFSNADLTVANGALSPVSSADGGITWTATFTPNAGVTDATNIITLDNTGVATAAGNAGIGVTNSANYAIDTLRPTATIAIDDSALKIGDAATVTITFSEAVSGLTGADLTVANGTLGALTSSDGGVTWSAALTPAPGVTDTTNLVTFNSAGVSDAAGNAGAGTVSSANYTIDTAAPTAAIVLSDSALTVGESATVTITFSEAVTGLTLADLSAGAGTLGGLTSSDGGVTWTATLTPSAATASAANVVTLAANSLADLAGNANAGAASSANYTVDTRLASSSVTLSDSALKAGETSIVTIAFSQAVTGFSNADLTVANGALSPVSSADGGITWTATFTPNAGVTDATNIITLDNTGVATAAGNAGIGVTNSANYAIDTLRPTATIAIDDSALKIGDAATVTITFSEAVSGFTGADLTVANGTLGALTSSDGGVTWSAALTPAPGVTDTTNLVTLNSAGVSDAAGNAGAGTVSSATYTIDTAAPTAAIVLSDSALTVGESATLTITFSEAVTGLTLANLSAGAGTLGGLTSSDGGVTWTATLTPSAATASATNVVTLAANSLADLAGNANAGATSSANYTVDTRLASSSVTLSDSALKAGETSVVTIAFSQAVTGFSNADLTVANGALSPVSSADGGITWTATFTPNAGITDATNVITLDNTGVATAAGNAGVGVTSSANYAIDTLPPTATIALSDSALKIGETAIVTITFSEAVTGLTLSDLSAGAGALGGLASVDGGVTWTAVLTPSAATASAANLVTLAGSTVADLAGNANAGAASSASYSVQTVRPTAAITLSHSALSVGETSVVTIAFSEAVNGFTNADLTVANGTLAPVSSADGGITWRAAFTPNAGTTAAINAITLDNAGVTNGAGNAGVGVTGSANYAVDTVRPSATIALSDRMLTMGETATVTITFSEAVTGFTNADLAVEHGTLAALTSTDGGVTWRATLTPDAATRADGAIALATSGVADLAGNAGDTRAMSSTYSIDTWLITDRRDASTDGAPSSSVTVIDPATGLAMVQLKVPVIAAFDAPPALGKPGVADIPLGIASADLVARLPVGAGLVAAGPASLLTHAQATTDLIGRIDSTTDTGSTEQQQMRAQAHSFLDALSAGTLVESRTLTLSSGTNFPAGQPIEIAGGAGPNAIGLVIDTHALRPDITLQLDGVDFAAVIGAATISGGAGRNLVLGDHSAQKFSLGAGDDVGDGGGGSDLLAGGAGNDLLLGGTGDDVLQGGRSDRGDWTFVVTPDGALAARHALATFQPGATESVAGADLNRDAAGLGFVNAKSGQLVELALLYDAAFGRAPDLGGLEFYARGYTTAGAVMQSFLGSSEWRAANSGGLSDSAFLTKMYQQVLHREPDQAGFAFWLDALAGKSGAPMARAAFLTEFALSPEHRALLAGAGDVVVGVGAQAREGDWFAHSGDDRLQGGAGSDVIVGGDGIDTLVYNGKVDDYRFLLGKDGQLRVEDKASGDIDTISGIEKGEFSDGTISLAFTQADPQTLQSVAMMYQVVLDRPADAGGFAFWLGSHDNSTHMARMFVESAEFTRHYGALDDAHFVATLLANSGVASTGSVAAGWEAWLGTHSRADLVVALIGDPAVTGAQFGNQGLWLM